MKAKLTTVLILFLVASIAGVAFAAQLTDINGHWAEDKINQWVADGLVSGYPDGSFKPNQEVTRAEFVALVNKAFEKVDQTASCNFSDVPKNAWYYIQVASANKAGFIKGYDGNIFKPNAPVSRQEAGAIIGRMLQLAIPADNNLSQFTDAVLISAWAKDWLNAVVAKDIMAGYPDGTFKPARSITRAEAVVTLDRALALQPKAPVAVEEKSTKSSGGGGGGGGGGGNKTVSVTGVTLNKASLELTAGESFDLDAVVEPSNASNKNVTWASNNAAVATVNENGLVTAVSTGTANITVTTVSGGKTAVCKVTVSAPAFEINGTAIKSSFLTTSLVRVEFTVSDPAVTKNDITVTADDGTVLKWEEGTAFIYNGVTTTPLNQLNNVKISATNGTDTVIKTINFTESTGEAPEPQNISAAKCSFTGNTSFMRVSFTLTDPSITKDDITVTANDGTVLSWEEGSAFTFSAGTDTPLEQLIYVTIKIVRGIETYTGDVNLIEQGQGPWTVTISGTAIKSSFVGGANLIHTEFDVSDSTVTADEITVTANDGTVLKWQEGTSFVFNASTITALDELTDVTVVITRGTQSVTEVINFQSTSPLPVITIEGTAEKLACVDGFNFISTTFTVSDPAVTANDILVIANDGTVLSWEEGTSFIFAIGTDTPLEDLHFVTVNVSKGLVSAETRIYFEGNEEPPVPVEITIKGTAEKLACVDGFNFISTTFTVSDPAVTADDILVTANDGTVLSWEEDEANFTFSIATETPLNQLTHVTVVVTKGTQTVTEVINFSGNIEPPVPVEITISGKAFKQEFLGGSSLMSVVFDVSEPTVTAADITVTANDGTVLTWEDKSVKFTFSTATETPLNQLSSINISVSFNGKVYTQTILFE